MPSLMNPFNFGRPKEIAARPPARSKPTRSSSLPASFLQKKILSFGRSKSFRMHKSEPRPKSDVAEEGELGEPERGFTREYVSLCTAGNNDERPDLLSAADRSYLSKSVTSPYAESYSSSRSPQTHATKSNDSLAEFWPNTSAFVPVTNGDSGPPEAMSPMDGDVDENDDVKSVEFSPLDEAVILMLQELDDNMLESVPCVGILEEQPLETIYEETDSDEYTRNSTPELRSSSVYSITAAGEPPSEESLEPTQQEVHDDKVVNAPPTRSSPLTYHEARAAVREWEERKKFRRKSYVATLPPSPRSGGLLCQPVPYPTSNDHHPGYLEVELQPFDYDDLD